MDRSNVGLQENCFNILLSHSKSQSFFLLNRTMRHLEAGLFKRLYEGCIEQVGRDSFRASKMRLFESLEAYVNEYSGFSDLVLDNFWPIFRYYFFICSLVFVTFCAHHLTKLIEKRTIFVRLLLRFYMMRILSWVVGCISKARTFRSNLRLKCCL